MTHNDSRAQTASTRGFQPGKTNWTVVLGIAGMHIGAVAALFYFSWTGLGLAILLMWVSGGLGITLCFHRLLTHRSFKTPKWFEYFLTALGCLAWQGGPVQWVGTHRLHHKHSDEEMDPHSPQHGFTWSHVLWCMFEEPGELRAVDAAKDLMRDKGLALLNKYFYVFNFILAGLLYLGGAAWEGQLASGLGLSWVLWGICFRTAAVYHVTWFVNSASHTWGYRNFETGDHSTNLWWVALLGFGEGWHNNHHADQRSAAHGMRWFEFDLTYATIRLLSLVGLASEVVQPRRLDEMVSRKTPTEAPRPASETPSFTSQISEKLPKPRPDAQA